MNSFEPFVWASYKNTCIHSLFNMSSNGEKYHHRLRLLICYTGHFDEKKTAKFVSVAICVRSYRLNTVLKVIGEE